MPQVKTVLFIARGGGWVELRRVWVFVRRIALFLFSMIFDIFFGILVCVMPFSPAASAVFSSPAGLWVIGVVPAFSAAIAFESGI